MTKFLKIVGFVIAGIVIGLVFSAVSNNVSKSFGGVYAQSLQYFYEGISVGKSNQLTISNAGVIATTGTVKIGTNGTALSLVGSGTCTLVSDASIVATTTGTATCVTTGSLAGDRVFVSFSTTTTKIAAQYVIAGTVAGTDSTTVRLINLTGTDAVPSATNGFGSSTSYSIYR